MPTETRTVSSTRDKRLVRGEYGEDLRVPNDWALLPPGDAGLTRRVKAAGPSWTVKEKRGKRTFSRGVWAPAATIERARKVLEQERADPAYQRRLEAGRKRREAEQRSYVGEFREAIVAYLGFADRYESLAYALAEQVAAHATPVGSGTVARTKRIPINERARAAVLAWMRHKTSDYDRRYIARQKGRRREVRREIAQQSRRILAGYRSGRDPAADCPLQAALSTSEKPPPVARKPAKPRVATAATDARQRIARLPSKRD